MGRVNKKQIIFIIAAVIFLVVFAITFTLCWFLTDESYEVDLRTIKTVENIVWHDEFEATEINTNNWRIEPGTDADSGEPFDGTQKGRKVVRKGGYWTLDQCVVEKTQDGDETVTALKIRTQKVDGKWQSAGIISDQALAQKYGYFEVRARLPKFYGTWSAFWMMPYNAPKATDGKAALDAKTYGSEIDIMEAPAYARKNNQVVQQALHIGDYNLGTGTSTFNMKWLTENAGDIYDNFHVYGFYWDENMYKFYIDNICVWTTSYNRTGNVSGVPQYLFLSTEIGGEDGVVGTNPWKAILPKGKQLVTDNPEDVQYGDFEIDYVRTYRIPSTEFAVNNQKKF